MKHCEAEIFRGRVKTSFGYFGKFPILLVPVLCRTKLRVEHSASWLATNLTRSARFLKNAKKGRFAAGVLVLGCVWSQLCGAQDKHPAPTQAPAIVNLNFCRPAYPRESMRRSESGAVKLEFTIGVNGRLVGSRIIKSSGFRDLDMAALTALIHCTFKPAYRNEVPVQASFTMEYQWVLGQQ